MPGRTKPGRVGSSPARTSNGPAWTRPWRSSWRTLSTKQRATPDVCASRAPQCGPFQHRATGGRTKPVRARERLHARPPGRSEGLIEGVMEWEQLGLVALGDGADASYAVEAWEVLARGLRLAGVRSSPCTEPGGS